MGTGVGALGSALYPDEARYLDAGDGTAFLSLWSRHRDAVRAELEAAGLSPREAETRINDVFVRMMDRRASVDRSRPLVDTLRELAHAVALDRVEGRQD